MSNLPLCHVRSRKPVLLTTLILLATVSSVSLHKSPIGAEHSELNEGDVRSKSLGGHITLEPEKTAHDTRRDRMPASVIGELLERRLSIKPPSTGAQPPGPHLDADVRHRQNVLIPIGAFPKAGSDDE